MLGNPVVRLLGCHARGRRSVPHNRESGQLIWHCPSGHKLYLTSGTADMAMWSDCNTHTVVAHDHAGSHMWRC